MFWVKMVFQKHLQNVHTAFSHPSNSMLVNLHLLKRVILQKLEDRFTVLVFEALKPILVPRNAIPFTTLTHDIYATLTTLKMQLSLYMFFIVSQNHNLHTHDVFEYIKPVYVISIEKCLKLSDVRIIDLPLVNL